MHFKDFKNIILKFNEYDLPGHELLLKIAPPSRINTLKLIKFQSTQSWLQFYYYFIQILIIIQDLY